MQMFGSLECYFGSLVGSWDAWPLFAILDLVVVIHEIRESIIVEGSGDERRWEPESGIASPHSKSPPRTWQRQIQEDRRPSGVRFVLGLYIPP